jgi:hypothetical protein
LFKIKLLNDKKFLRIVVGLFTIGIPFFYSFARQKAIIRKHIEEDS